MLGIWEALFSTTAIDSQNSVFFFKCTYVFTLHLFSLSFGDKSPETASGPYSAYGSRCQGNDEIKRQREHFAAKSGITKKPFPIERFPSGISEKGHLGGLYDFNKKNCQIRKIITLSVQKENRT